ELPTVRWKRSASVRSSLKVSGGGVQPEPPSCAVLLVRLTVSVVFMGLKRRLETVARGTGKRGRAWKFSSHLQRRCDDVASGGFFPTPSCLPSFHRRGKRRSCRRPSASRTSRTSNAR